MSVFVSVMRLQQSVQAILGVFLSRVKSLIDSADLQVNDAPVTPIEDSLLFSGSLVIDAVN